MGRKFVTSFWKSGQPFRDEMWQEGDGVSFTQKSRDVIYGQIIKVRFTLWHVMKAQWGSNCIALNFL